MERQCKYCGEVFSDMAGRVFSNHVRWCHKNPDRNNTENITKAIRESYEDRLGVLTEFSVQCEKCGLNFTIVERANQHPAKEHYFCSRSCSNSRPQNQSTKDKIRQGVLLYQKTNGIISKRDERKCLYCNSTFFATTRGPQKYCSQQCFREDQRSSNEFLNYRHDCSFKFNVWHYPQEFDLDLIRKWGWYSASNRGNNINGVSRDHRISVKFGWKNKISPNIISHPANCKLMKNRDNVSKHDKCSIELQELIKAIKLWDHKYQ